VLSGNLRPHESVMRLLQESDLPAIASPLDSYSIASRIHSMTIKTLPGDTEKITRIQELTNKYVNIQRLLEKIRQPAAAAAAPPPTSSTPSSAPRAHPSP
jgi:BioD-like phosphotransacetylase family protein